MHPFRPSHNSVEGAWERTERNKVARGQSNVPFLSKKTCLCPCRILGLTSRISTIGIFSTGHDKLVSSNLIFDGVHLSTSNNIIFVPVRSGRSVLPNKKKGCNTYFFFLFLNILFLSGCTESIRFPQNNQSAPIHAAHKSSIRFVPILSGGS